MGEIVTINQNQKTNYFAQMQDSSDESDDVSDKEIENDKNENDKKNNEIKEKKVEEVINPKEIPQIKNEEKKIIKLKMKRGKKNKKKGKGKYDKQFEKIEGNIFEGI